MTQDAAEPGHAHKDYTIIVNARRKVVPTDLVSFEQVVALAFDPVPPNALFTVTYRGARAIAP